MLTALGMTRASRPWRLTSGPQRSTPTSAVWISRFRSSSRPSCCPSHTRSVGPYLERRAYSLQERFEALGIKPPKGCLMYGPPGTGKTLMARACAAQTKSCFLKLAAPQLVQMFIGDGAKVWRQYCESELG